MEREERGRSCGERCDPEWVSGWNSSWHLSPGASTLGDGRRALRYTFRGVPCRERNPAAAVSCARRAASGVALPPRLLRPGPSPRRRRMRARDAEMSRRRRRSRSATVRRLRFDLSGAVDVHEVDVYVLYNPDVVQVSMRTQRPRARRSCPGRSRATAARSPRTARPAAASSTSSRCRHR